MFRLPILAAVMALTAGLAFAAPAPDLFTVASVKVEAAAESDHQLRSSPHGYRSLSRVMGKHDRV